MRCSLFIEVIVYLFVECVRMDFRGFKIVEQQKHDESGKKGLMVAESL